MLNHVTMMGRLCADPELMTTQNGIPVTSFRIAVERNYTNQDNERETDFFNVTAWRGVAEVVCEYFAKGRMIAVDGRLETQSWVDRDNNKRVSVGIVAESVYFADSKREEEKPARGRTASKREEEPARGRTANKSTGRTKGRRAA